MSAPHKRTVGIVGTGNVGVAAAYALFTRRVASEIVLVDRDAKRAEGEAMDLAHAQALVGRIDVRSGGYEALAGAAVIVVAAGVGQRPGETRLDLLNRNAAVFRDVARELDRHAPEAVVVVATNPVDVLTYAMQELSHRPHGRVIGTGTMLDSARFRALLGRAHGVSPRSIHAYVLGEHGDSEVPIWSNATVGGVSLECDAAEMKRIVDDVRGAAYSIIEKKGYTNLAIGLVIATLVEMIFGDQRAVVPVSVRLNGEYGLRDVCLSIPAIVGISGVERTLTPPLSDAELAGLRHAAAVLGECGRSLELKRAES